MGKKSASVPQHNAACAKLLLTKASKRVDGVFYASLDMKTRIVNIHYDAKKTNPDALCKAITELGYSADDLKRNEKTHEALPECCKSH